MLALTRKRGESLDLYDSNNKLIGTVFVAGIDGNKVRIAMDFPLSIKIVRRELLGGLPPRTEDDGA